jgi:hypothetical protein
MVNARQIPGHLVAGDQKVLSSPDVVENFAGTSDLSGEISRV